ncbi:hypothetical protein C8046_12305 [Serinibacter arcticus]|uniref:Uncharacterized protein n=1 Tax=Serinibacter arcticus TaxID=1655435 RepID=A0A2U1ZWF9_9MICO|nr:hypothetical protein [Serinibacter arcticus]PWD51326.1 hypothetical protein C8046_12305 [Serinibacter arcticus]
MSSSSPTVSTTFTALAGGSGIDGATIELALLPEPGSPVPGEADAEELLAVDPDPTDTVATTDTLTLDPAVAVPTAEATVAGVTVRRGGLVDVNSVVRLLREGSQEVDIDGDGDPDGPVDPEAARSAARMAISHVVLEQGDLWVAHDDAGTLQAISVWMPGALPGASDELHRILERELHLPDPSEAIGPPEHVRPQLMESMAGVMEHVHAHEPRLVLFAVTVAPQSDPAAVVALARAVVAPVVRGDGDVLAVALDGDRARLLQAVGFAEVAAVPLGELNTVWIGRA